MRIALGPVMLRARGLFFLLLLPACTAVKEDALAENEQHLEPIRGTPPVPLTPFDQGRVCSNVLKARAGFREIDLAQGVLRWNCGDVNGVTVPDFGQEYCEFHAVLNGRVVDRIVARPGPNDVVECLFTSVFADAKGSEDATEEYERELAEQIAPQLRNAQSLDPAATVMQVGFNSRDAATVLVDDCAGLGRSEQLDAQRQAACVVAWNAADAAKKAQLEQACKGVDLAKPEAFARAEALGVAPRLDDEDERDLAACILVKKAPNGGVGWRNSDPSICARAARAAACGYDFAAIPDAVTGFELKGWTNREALPVGCRYLEIDDGAGKKASPHLVVCTANKADVDEYNRARKPLQMMCRDKFGINLALQAPLRALATKNPSFSSKETTTFCDAFAGPLARGASTTE
jgi:hypothetical protein